ncbi:MAG: hypothetical protein ACLGIA_02015 [Actinomycetes bacterium]
MTYLLVSIPGEPKPPSGDAAACASDELPAPLREHPGPETAGVPAGVSLRRVDGDYHTSRDGEVVDRLLITGRLYIDNDDVKVKCTEVRRMTVNSGKGLEMWLSTLGDPNGVSEGSALASTNYTLRRVNILGTIDGLKADGDVDVRDSYIHDLFRTGDPNQESGVTHNDGVQIGKGSDIVFRHNTFHIWTFEKGQKAGENLFKSPFGNGVGYATSAFLIGASTGQVRDVLIKDNVIRGRTSKPFIVSEKNGYRVKGLRIVDNVLGRESRDYPVMFAGVQDATVEGNVFVDGSPADPGEVSQ